MKIFRFSWTENVKIAVDIEAEDYATALDTFYKIEQVDNPIFLSREFGGVDKIEELVVAQMEPNNE